MTLLFTCLILWLSSSYVIPHTSISRIAVKVITARNGLPTCDSYLSEELKWGCLRLPAFQIFLTLVSKLVWTQRHPIPNVMPKKPLENGVIANAVLIFLGQQLFFDTEQNSPRPVLSDAVNIPTLLLSVFLYSSNFNAFVHIAPTFWACFPSSCQSFTFFSPVLGESAVFLIHWMQAAYVNVKTLGLWSVPQGRAYSLSESWALQPSEGISNNKFPILSNFY